VKPEERIVFAIGDDASNARSANDPTRLRRGVMQKMRAGSLGSRSHRFDLFGRESDSPDTNPEIVVLLPDDGVGFKIDLVWHFPAPP
jgi:hypothetical protein